MAAGTGADELFPGQSSVGARVVSGGWWFWDFPVRIVAKVIVVVGEKYGGEGEVEVSGQPTWWSRDSSEDFVVVVGGKLEVSFDMMGSRGSDHLFSGGSLILFLYLSRVSAACPRSASLSHVSSSAVYPFHRIR